MTKHENFRKLLILQSRLHNFEDLIKPDRLLLREGSMLKICRNTLDARYLILLNDILIIAKPYATTTNSNFNETSDSLKVGYKLALDELSLAVPDLVDEFPKDFYVKARKKSFMFRAENPDLKKAWIEALEKATRDFKVRK